MVSSSLRRKAAVFLLFSAFTLPMASTAEPRLGSQRSWSLLEQAWNTLLAIWSEAGCTLDPNGKCAPTSSTSDEGCTIDPDGKCAASASQPSIPGESLDAGCTLDPDGKCYSGS